MEKEVTIRVGSRKSELALIQTNKIIDALTVDDPSLKFAVVTIATTGDKILDVALSKIGEKSLFTKELEDALLDMRVDFVVHSLKDLPTVLPEGLVIGAVYRRDDPRDAVVMHPKHKTQNLATLPAGSVIGTSSLRRIAQLMKAYPHLAFTDIRGNLNTRLRKLDEDAGVMYDAIVLAVAGLVRMDWAHRISETLEPDVCMYSVCQGAMAVECRHDDAQTLALLSRLQHRDTAVRCTAERAFLRTLEGGCSVPVCVHSTLRDNTLTLRGGVYSMDGAQSVVDSMDTELPSDDSCDKTEVSSFADFASIAPNSLSRDDLAPAYDLGVTLAMKVMNNGASRILAETKQVMLAAILEEKRKREMKNIGT